MTDQAEAMRQLDSLSEVFLQFIQEVKQHSRVAEAEEEHLARLSDDCVALGDDYDKLVKLMKSCKKMLKQSQVLAVQEASLSSSLKHLEIETKEQSTRQA